MNMNMLHSVARLHVIKIHEEQLPMQMYAWLLTTLCTNMCTYTFVEYPFKYREVHFTYMQSVHL